MTGLKYGIVSDYKPGYAKVYFAEDDIVTKWWPVLQGTSLKDKGSAPLNATEQVACLADEFLEEGVVLGAIYNDEDTPPAQAGPGKFVKVFEDGTVLQYDKNSHELTATVQGKATLTATDDISVSTQKNLKATALIKASITAPDVDITGNLVVSGNIAFGGTMAGAGSSGFSFDGTTLKTPNLEAAGNVKAGTVDLKTHTHSGVQTGGGTSGPPL